MTDKRYKNKKFLMVNLFTDVYKEVLNSVKMPIFINPKQQFLWHEKHCWN